MRRRATGGGGGGGEDDLSVLPDELPLIILGRLDTRTTLGAAALSQHLDRLVCELPALEFSISDVLPPHYHDCVCRRYDAVHGSADA
ncbi:hypothetical protein E2562_017669 [Oryza meyeriana var. granulata]|uniref:F-box domain-containing protein n=1 Tax=Oryza meyeriana var. granulata TaxID=110450 RepID=A0A6G1BWH2_9ORYZ|nr:hypothetical protein E2562_017669 [Oryza meyeriana var. granulata]